MLMMTPPLMPPLCRLIISPFSADYWLMAISLTLMVTLSRRQRLRHAFRFH
jgi:hypothetical protein